MREKGVLTEAQKRMIDRVHVNLGHPRREEMIRILGNAHAKPEVLHYLKHEYRCPRCEASSRAVQRRRAAIPRAYAFNRIAGADLFFVTYGGKEFTFLNIVRHGTNLQWVGLVGEGQCTASFDIWSTYARGWLRHYGPPEVLIADGGGEFDQAFARHLEQSGAFHK
eukprot:5124529-Pyramimonas_sp.AAC.1